MDGEQTFDGAQFVTCAPLAAQRAVRQRIAFETPPIRATTANSRSAECCPLISVVGWPWEGADGSDAVDDSGDRELMDEAAKFLYGDSWQERFARELSERPRERPPEGVSSSQVSEWASGRRRPPLWVMAALAFLVVENIDDESERSSRLKVLLTRLNAATQKAYEEGWDGRDGLRVSIVSPEPSLKDEMIASQSNDPVSIGDGVTATWKVPWAKAFSLPDVIDITLKLGGDVTIALAAHLIVEWIMEKFSGRAENISIKRKQYEFDHGELTKVIEETITYERR